MKSRTTRRILIIAAVIVALGVLVRAAMPWAAARYVNNQLADMGDYRGHVSDVDIALIRGAYTMRDATVTKREAQTDQPFLVLPRLDISVEWSALFDGELVGEIQMQKPVANLIQGESNADTQTGAGVNCAPGIEAEESLNLHNLNVVLNNLTNVEQRDAPIFADFDVNGRLMENTPLAITGHINPNAEQPTFDVNMSLEGAPLVGVNPWLEEFLNVDAEKGTFSMYAELAAADGRFEGYIKPLLEDAEIFRLDEPSSGPLQKAWEALVGLVSGILTNPGEDQVATQIPFEGDIENPDAGILSAAINLLRNAFVAAFTHSLEGTVSLEDVETGDGE
jgi:hypothetical protein